MHIPCPPYGLNVVSRRGPYGGQGIWLSGSIFSHTGIRYLLRHIPGTFPRGAPLWGGMCRNLPSLPPTWYLSSCKDVRGYGGPHRYHVYWRELRIPFLPYTGNVYSVKILPVYGRIRKGILSQEYSMIRGPPTPPIPLSTISGIMEYSCSR